MSRRRVFVDTGAWYAAQVRDDDHHEKAAAIMTRLVRERAALLTTELVMGETYTLLRTRCGFDSAWRFVEAARASARLEVIPLAAIDVTATYEVLQKHSDQDFSFVDAASFVTMRARRLEHAFAFDRHFKTAGFILV